MADVPLEGLGTRLKQERERRGWTQEELYERSGVSVSSIRRWENDRAKPRQEQLDLLIKVFGKPPKEWGNTRSRWNNVPPQTPYFTGRSLLLERLHQRLAEKKTTALNLALSGLSGIGKTATAIEYAYRYDSEYEAVLWVNADSEKLVSDFAGLATVLDLPECSEQDQSRAVEAVKRWLREHDSWLLIFDNADDMNLVCNYLPGGTRGVVLLTTRAQEPGPYFEKINMPKLSRTDGTHFLLRHKYDDDAKLLSSATLQERKEARLICEQMKGLALLLDQAASFLKETGCTLSDYLDMLNTHRKDLLEWRGGTASGHPEPAAVTWLMALKRIEQARPAAAQLLRFCAFLHPKDIPESMIIKGADALEPVLQCAATDTFAWNEAIAELRKYSLVYRDGTQKTLAMHDLVQAVIMDHMPQEAARELAGRAMQVVSAAFPKAEQKTWQQCGQLLPHVERVVQHLERLGMMNEEAGRLVSEAAIYLRDRSRYAEAEALLLPMLHALEWQRGPEHSCLISPLNTLASLYMYLGKYEQAEAICKRAFQLHEQQTEHPRKDIPLYIQATAYISLEKYKLAEPLLLQVLQIRRQELGETHPEVATTLNSLAVLYTYQGRYEEAEKAYQQAWPIYEQHREYLKLAYVLGNLGELYIEQGQSPKSESLFQQAREICEQQLEPGHHGMAFPLNGLAHFYFEQGNYTAAEPLYQQALQILEQAVGQEHPDIAGPLHGLANLYREQGDEAQAERLYERARHILEQGSGTGTSRNG